MKRLLLTSLAVLSFSALPAFSQTAKDSTIALGLPGDNLDLYAVLDLFQKSKTIEAFEKSLNDSSKKINNLDLNLDKKVDFIKVTTKKDGESFSFILKVDVSKNETQDVAVILLDRDKEKKVSLQIVGDEDIYGKDYVVEPKGNSSITPNPGYVGADPVTVEVPATTTVVVQSAPIVQYVYSPAYVPYYPPYYYGYYPPYFAFTATIAFGIYASNHYYHHHGYYGGHYGGNNTVIINNRNNYNNYNSNRSRSNTVNNNMARGSYGSASGNRGGGRGTSASTRPAGGAGSGSRPGGGGASASQRPAGGGGSASTRPSTNQSSRPSSGNSSSSRYSSPSRSSSSMSGSRSSSGGGGRSMGGGGMGGGGGGRR